MNKIFVLFFELIDKVGQNLSGSFGFSKDGIYFIIKSCSIGGVGVYVGVGANITYAKACDNEGYSVSKEWQIEGGTLITSGMGGDFSGDETSVSVPTKTQSY